MGVGEGGGGGGVVLVVGGVVTFPHGINISAKSAFRIMHLCSQHQVNKHFQIFDFSRELLSGEKRISAFSNVHTNPHVTHCTEDMY